MNPATNGIQVVRQTNCLQHFAANRSCVLLTLNLIKMDIQTEVQKIHHQFGVSEKANYEIQKLFDKLILEDRAEQLRLGAVVGRSEQLCECKKHSIKTNYGFEICTKCGNEFND